MSGRFRSDAAGASAPTDADPADVAKAFTVQSTAIAHGHISGMKPIENRDKRFGTGWRAQHVAKKGSNTAKWTSKALEIEPALQPFSDIEEYYGHIVSLQHVSEIRLLADCRGNKWALGKQCHLMDKTILLKTPVACKGSNCTPWAIPEEVRRQIVEQLPDCQGIVHDLSPLCGDAAAAQSSQGLSPGAATEATAHPDAAAQEGDEQNRAAEEQSIAESSMVYLGGFR